MEDMVFGRRYRVTEKIGSGGMAEVFKAVDETLGRPVAVKVLHPRYAADPSFAARFRQEAQAAANLQSPYIVNIYDWGQDGDTYYIVMEYVRGTDLKTIITEQGALPSQRVAEIGAEVCSALGVAHSYDVIHRDVKPHNIMVTPDGSVKVMDFGIARAGNTTMTQTGSVLGTAHYVSPEQAQGRELKPTSDIYSLGVVLYEAATGKLPFDADTPVAVALKQVNEQPVRPSRINPGIDPGLERVIGRALAKDPAKRYSTAEEMRRDLRRVVAGEPVGGAPSAGPAAVAPSDRTAVMPVVDTGDGYGAGGPVIRSVARKRSVWPWVALAAVLVAAGFIVAYTMVLLGPQGAPVPEVTGLSKSDAEVAIVQAGFILGEVTEEYSETEKGLVIDQSPVANAEAPKGTGISITISKGPELVEIPTFLGMTESEALAEISRLGLTPNALPGEYNADFPAGTVLRQQPGPGEKVKKGATVQYVVSRGIETTKVPDVKGKSRSSAESKLRKAGFKVSVTEEFSETVPKGTVMSQNPAAGITIATDSTVSIVVSKGPQNVTVVDVIGQSIADAQAALEGLGLKVTITYEAHANNGTVLEQDPSPGTKVPRGTTVNLLVDGTQP